jgi:hypothetical protein
MDEANKYLPELSAVWVGVQMAEVSGAISVRHVRIGA